MGYSSSISISISSISSILVTRLRVAGPLVRAPDICNTEAEAALVLEPGLFCVLLRGLRTRDGLRLSTNVIVLTITGDTGRTRTTPSTWNALIVVKLRWLIGAMTNCGVKTRARSSGMRKLYVWDDCLRRILYFVKDLNTMIY